MINLVLFLVSATPVQIAVLDVREIGAVEGQGSLVSEEVARSLPAEAFNVTTAAQLAAILGVERQRQLLGCEQDASSCSAELANALGAEVVAQTTLARVDKGLRCNVVFIAGRDGASLERLTAEAPNLATLLERIHEEVGAAASRLYSRLRPGGSIEPGRPGVRRYAWIPALAGAAAAGSGAALFAVAADTYATLNTRDGRVTDARALGESGRTAQTAAWVLCAVGTAALLTSAGMFAFGASTPPRVVVAPVVGPSGGGLTLTMELP